MIWRVLLAAWDFISGKESAIAKEWRELAEMFRSDWKELREQLDKMDQKLGQVREDMDDCIEQRTKQQREIEQLKARTAALEK